MALRVVVALLLETFYLSAAAKIEFAAPAPPPAATAGTLNGSSALIAIIAASPTVDKAPENVANPFTTLPRGTQPKPPQPLIEGNPSSPVRVVAYEDLQCPDCAVYRRMMDEKLLPAYRDKVAFEHRDFPLPRHTWARKAAIAARFFQELNPEVAVEYRRHTLANFNQTTPENFKDRLAEFSKTQGVDPAQAVAALDEPRFNDLVEKDYQDGVARGVSKTPTVFVNGQPFIETFTAEEISKVIDAELKR